MLRMKKSIIILIKTHDQMYDIINVPVIYIIIMLLIYIKQHHMHSTHYIDNEMNEIVTDYNSLQSRYRSIGSPLYHDANDMNR